MKTVRVENLTRQKILCDHCEVADNMLTRVRGLLGKSTLRDGCGLLIMPCPSIHMFGMKFPLDVVFLTKENRVTDLVENIAPGKYFVARGQFGNAHSALELPVGTSATSGTERGDEVAIEKRQSVHS
jgi:uncharacterized membrane protein (UPF0127 family)